MSGIFDQVINYAPFSSLKGTVTYKGTWSAATNTPTLLNPPDSTTNGNYYVVSAAGTQFSLSFNIGDWIISNGSAWEKVDNTDAVNSVFGRTGAVVGVSTDYSSVGINSTAIGATTPSTVAATTLTASGNLTTTGGTAHVIEMGAGSFTLSRTGIASTVTDFASSRLNVTTSQGLINVRDVATDATNKAVRIGNSHYTNAEEPLALIVGSSTNTTGVVSIGGGTSTFNAATTVAVYAAADNTTATGTQVASFTTTKLGVLPTTASTSTTTGALTVAGGVGVAGAAFIGDTLNITGNVGIATSAIADNRIYIAGNTVAGATSAFGIRAIESIDSTKTNQYATFASRPYTATAAFTCSSIVHFFASPFTFGVGSTVGSQVGFLANSNMTGATNNWGFQGSIAAASGRYNLYMDGTAQNYLLGKTGIGQTPSATDTLAVTGTTLLTGNTAVTGTLSATGALAIGNTVNTVSPTSPNRTVTIVIGGTTYYLAAKTTND